MLEGNNRSVDNITTWTILPVFTGKVVIIKLAASSSKGVDKRGEGEQRLFVRK